MGLKSALDVDWAGFIREWCLGSSPAFSESDADTAFDALERNWPERVSSELNQPGRSPIMMGAMVRDGLVVATCETLPGFAEVARRMASRG